MSKVMVVHQALWSAVGMIVVIVVVGVAAYRVLHHERPAVCAPSIIGHRTVTTYDPSYTPPAKNGVAITPILLCKNGSVIKP